MTKFTWPGAACSQQLQPCLGPDLQATGHALPRFEAFMLQELTAARGCMCHPIAFCTAPCAPKGVEQLLLLDTWGMTERPGSMQADRGVRSLVSDACVAVCDTGAWCHCCEESSVQNILLS